jgi:hypothetical protein
MNAAGGCPAAWILPQTRVKLQYDNRRALLSCGDRRIEGGSGCAPIELLHGRPSARQPCRVMVIGANLYRHCSSPPNAKSRGLPQSTLEAFILLSPLRLAKSIPSGPLGTHSHLHAQCRCLGASLPQHCACRRHEGPFDREGLASYLCNFSFEAARALPTSSPA